MTAALMQFRHRPSIKWLLRTPQMRRNWCGLCRRPANGLFDVPDDVWLHYVGEEQRHQVVCIACWHWLANVIDGGAYQAQHGGPLPLWSDAWRSRHGVAPDEPSPPLPPWFTASEALCQPRWRAAAGLGWWSWLGWFPESAGHHI